MPIRAKQRPNGIHLRPVAPLPRRLRNLKSRSVQPTTSSGERTTLIASVILAIAPVILAGFSLMSAAGGSYEVFLALVQTLNVPAILTASYVGNFPTLALVALLTYLIIRHPPENPGTIQERIGTLIWWLPTFILILVLLPLNTLILIGSLFAAVTAMTVMALSPERAKTKPWSRSQEKKIRRPTRLTKFATALRSHEARIWIVIFCVLMALASLVTPFWLPPETLLMKGQSVSVGYVLRKDDNNLTIYWQDGRGVKHYDPSALEYREICEYKGSTSVPLIRKFKDPYIIKRPRLQPCPIKQWHL